jgi:2'-5' RNA ligase
LRLFVAVPIAPAAVGEVGEILAGVGPAGEARGIRWVQQEGLHLTLRFLGAAPMSAVEPTVSAVRAAVEGHPPFGIVLGGAGAFPRADRPRVLWLGIVEGMDQLTALTEDLEGRLADAGWSRSGRPFRPHLTVARTDAAPYEAGAAAGRALMDAAAGRRIAFAADRAVLYRSHLGRGPARYEVLADAPLGTAARA